MVSDAAADRADRVAREFGAKVVAPAEIESAQVDVFAPCAFGGGLSARTIPALRCSVVAGAANNQLLADADGALLEQRDIAYAPDFIANAGGVICAAIEYRGGTEGAAFAFIDEKIRANTEAVLAEVQRSGTLPRAAALALARERVRRAMRTRRWEAATE